MKEESISTSILYRELSHEIMGIAFEVHNQLGPGFSEDFYEKAFIFELEKRKIPYEQQKVITVRYKDIMLGTYRLDLVIDGKVIIELKAVSQINDLFKEQLLSYLKASGLSLGYLINFGAKSVQNVRLVNSQNSYQRNS